MPYYQKISGADKSLNLYALDSTKFPSSGGDYACSTSTAEPYHTATDYYSGTSRIYCNYGGGYTLTASVTGGSNMSSWSVARDTSGERGATTGTIMSSPANGATATIYKGDYLSIYATAKSTSYGSYNFSSLSAPTCTATAYNTVSVTNPSGNGVACDVYRGSTLIKSSLAAGSSYSDTGLSATTTYSYTLKATPTRSVTTYTVTEKGFRDGTAVGNYAPVTGNLTASFIATSSTTTQSGSVVTSSATSVTTPANASWHTIWSGSKQLTNTTASTVTASVSASTSWKYRITGSMTGQTTQTVEGTGTGSAEIAWSGMTGNRLWTVALTVTAQNSTSLKVQQSRVNRTSATTTLTKVEAYY